MCTSLNPIYSPRVTAAANVAKTDAESTQEESSLPLFAASVTGTPVKLDPIDTVAAKYANAPYDSNT